MTTEGMVLPPELFGEIIAFLDKEINTLYSCTLVCRAFHDAATPLLYKRISVSPPKVGLAWQVVEVIFDPSRYAMFQYDKCPLNIFQDTLGRKPFAASRLPSHLSYVQEFTLDGYLTKIRPSRQTPVPIIEKIPEALRMWHNLQLATLTPQKATGPALLNLVKALRHCPSLRAVTVNEFAMDEDVMPDLAEVVGLEEVTLLHPSRAAFMVLCDWIQRMQDTLVSLKLLGNCGSLTPGILRMLTSSILNIRTLAIGLSYSLTDLDIFTCLSQLPRLQHLRLRYYRQHRALPPELSLSSLQHLTVLHAPLSCKEDADALSAWIRRLSSSSPLESLETIASGCEGPKLCFDGLLSHIANRHHDTLHEVRMPMAYVRGPALQTVLTRCKTLRHLALTVAFSTLQSFPTMAIARASLWSVSLDVCDYPELVIGKKDALKIMQRMSQLRSITVNNVTWKGMWVAQQAEGGNATPEFVVSLVANVTRDIPPEEI